MTSASELFHVRRSRYGRHISSNSSLELGLDLAPDERSLHHHTTSRRSRREIGGCDPPRRRSTAVLPAYQQQPHRTPPYVEFDTVRVDEGSGHSSLGNNRINLSNFGVVGNRGGRRNENDRLPGVVLLARERLLDRLRGVSLSTNRRNNRASSHSNRNGLTGGDDYGTVNATGDFWDTVTSRESFSRDFLSTDSIFQTDQLSQTQATSSERKPPGLTQNALARLQLEVFTKSHKIEGGEVISLSASKECSICLENFAEGDELIRLSCDHRFHSVCLNPWIRSCGDCPYCRKEIVVNLN